MAVAVVLPWLVAYSSSIYGDRLAPATDDDRSDRPADCRARGGHPQSAFGHGADVAPGGHRRIVLGRHAQLGLAAIICRHAGAAASRIRIPSLRIDLPVVSGDSRRAWKPRLLPAVRRSHVPRRVRRSPGDAGHDLSLRSRSARHVPAAAARLGDRRRRGDDRGARIEVYSADDELHLYEIVRVKRHATDLSLAAVAPGQHQLVLQTSEGPTGTVPKLQVAARPVSVVRRATGRGQSSAPAAGLRSRAEQRLDPAGAPEVDVSRRRRSRTIPPVTIQKRGSEKLNASAGLAHAEDARRPRRRRPG